MPRIDPLDARRELAARELARRRLLDFATYVLPWYLPAAHHRLVAEALERVMRYVETGGREGIGRLLIFLPPRHGKTQLASKIFPAWALGRNPDLRVILVSYGADLAVENSRAVRDLIRDERYQAVFGALSAAETPVQLSEESRSAQSWALAGRRGGLMAAGVGGAITGKGAHLLVLDDLFKNRDEAESAASRDRVWAWWQSTAYTRLEQGGAVVGMMTRWHPDDWAGRLLRAMAEDPAADRYEVICLPALAEGEASLDEQARGLRDGVWVNTRDPLGREEGAALWPEKYDEEDLARIRANIGPYEWAALYQQRPYAREGHFFKREWFVVTERPPAPGDIVRRVRYWDKAGGRTRTSGKDYTAGVLMALTRDGLYYVEHVARRRVPAAERDAWMVEVGRTDALRPGPKVETWHQQDPGTAGVDSAQMTNRRFAEAGLRAQAESVTGSKEVRAGPWASMCAAGVVRLVRGAWNADFIDEHVAFPAGAHDDQVDAAASAFAKLVQGSRRRESRIL